MALGRRLGSFHSAMALIGSRLLDWGHVMIQGVGAHQTAWTKERSLAGFQVPPKRGELSEHYRHFRNTVYVGSPDSCETRLVFPSRRLAVGACPGTDPVGCNKLSPKVCNPTSSLQHHHLFSSCDRYALVWGVQSYLPCLQTLAWCLLGV